ncbi:MAG: hypothetical protein VXZ96_06400 [Myxococcota bacterium]|nr:hypothetical protein [Myxococcota bacterium]
MFALWMGLQMVMANDFSIAHDTVLNPHQQSFIQTVNQRSVKSEAGFQRYNTRTIKHHWTYSIRESYAEIESKLKAAGKTTVFNLYRSATEAYSPNELVILPKLSLVTADEWHQLLEQAPESLLVGDVPQEILEDCAAHGVRPKNLYITGERRLTKRLRDCFPKTTLFIEGVIHIEPDHEDDFLNTEHLPMKLMVSPKMDSGSASILKRFGSSVVILSHQLPNWFDSIYAESHWKSLHLPELTSLNTESATSIMAKPFGKVHLDGITTLNEDIAGVLTGTESHHLAQLAMPNLALMSPKSLGRLTMHIESLSVGPIPWTAKEVRAVQGTSGDIISYGTEVMTERATDLLFDRRQKDSRSFHFVSAKISDPTVLEKVGSIQYFMGLHRGLNHKDQRTIVDFTFDEWNMGLISLLEPLPRDSNHFKVDIAENTLRSFTSSNGYGLGGTKPLEVMKAIAENDGLWYVHDCHFKQNCFNVHQNGITKPYTAYLVDNYDNLKLGGTFTNEALEVLTGFRGSLEIDMTVLTPEQAAILAKGSFSELSVGFEEASLAALNEFIGYPGKLNLPDQLHYNRTVQHIMLATGQIDSPQTWEPESLMYLDKVELDSISISTPKALTPEQLRSVAQFKGVLYLNLNVPQTTDDPSQQLPQYQVTQQMLDIIATSQAKRLVLWLPVSDHLDWAVLSQFEGGLSVYAGPGRPEWFEPLVTNDQLHLYPTVTPSLLKLIDQYKGSELSLGAFVLTDALSQRMVKQTYAIGVSALNVDPAAIKTLLAATDKENMSVETSATSELCWTHIQNSICYTDIWDVYEDEDDP